MRERQKCKEVPDHYTSKRIYYGDALVDMRRRAFQGTNFIMAINEIRYDTIHLRATKTKTE